MMPEVVLFDMDGVLVKSTEAWFRIVEAAGLQFRGSQVTRAEFDPTFGQGTAADVQVFGFDCSHAQLDRYYIEEFHRHMPEVWVNPEAKPLLEFLAQQEIRCALVTNTVAPLAQEILGFAKLETYFSSICTADRVPHAKPAPDLVQLALSELKAPASKAVMIGDSRFDREAAQAAEVLFVGLELDATLRVESLKQFHTLLMGL
jgi:HAD superfamily hydrolase (TIGR01509 family)